jgi:hypothetical protein
MTAGTVLLHVASRILLALRLRRARACYCGQWRCRSAGADRGRVDRLIAGADRWRTDRGRGGSRADRGGLRADPVGRSSGR